MDETEREAANRLLEAAHAESRKATRRLLGRRKPMPPGALEKLQEGLKRHEEVIEQIRHYREARLSAKADE